MPRASIVLRIVLVLAVVGGVAAAVAFRGTFQPLAIKQHIGDARLAPLIFIAGSIGASLFFVPRTILAVAAGLLFGLWWGMLWTTIGSTLGSVGGFLLARYVNGGLVDASTLPRLAPILRAAEQGGWRAVALIRVFPLPHTPVNYALGVTRLSVASYTVGSLVGMLPGSFVYAQLGASGNLALSGGHWIGPTVVSLVLLALTIVLPRLGFVRRSLRLGANQPALDRRASAR